MQRYVEYVLSGSVGRRCLFTVFCLLVTALFCLGWLQPELRSRQALAQDNAVARQQVIAQQKKIARLPAIEQLPETPAPVSFSALKVVKDVGGQLVAWQPGPQQSGLKVLLPWSRVPDFFRQLATFPRLTLPAFTLRAAGERVIATFTLEHRDENR